MWLTQGPGPDLHDESKFVEIKFALKNPKKNKSDYPRAWTILEHQINYTDLFTGIGFWGLGLYELDRPVKEIKTNEKEELESIVLSRELYITTWSWIYQFPSHETKGKTKFSQWNNTFRYQKLKDIPKITEAYSVEKGLVYLTQGVDSDLFDIQTQ